jgi:hypothetical protein
MQLGDPEVNVVMDACFRRHDRREMSSPRRRESRFYPKLDACLAGEGHPTQA